MGVREGVWWFVCGVELRERSAEGRKERGTIISHVRGVLRGLAQVGLH